MKRQDEKFIGIRDKVRKVVYMKRLDITGQCYRKLMGLEVNKEKNRALSNVELDTLKGSIEEIIDLLNEFRDELYN